MDDLFAAERAARRSRAAPLAARMRPASLAEVVGQPDLLRPGASFRTMIEQGRPVSMILWGPPGSGKTTLARLVADETDAEFVALSATSAGVKDVRATLADARRRLEEQERRTVLFLDEIHRFNKAQQDALLPGVEDGTLILVGATTENPFFEVNSPLISRSTLFRLEALAPGDVAELLERALIDDARGLGALGLGIDAEARDALAQRVGGDARLALTALDVAATLAAGRGDDAVRLGDVEEALQRRIVRYDKAGDQHYDVISAFIKAMRGSDPDAALYWLHLMLEAGEDPEFIARRLVIFASEDVGLADRHALPLAVAAAHALAFVGLPEAAHHLTHAALYLAVAPKSNSVPRAMRAAREAVAETPGATVPPPLRSAVHAGQHALGDGVGYRYPHDYPDAVVDQQYLPDAAVGRVLYRPGGAGDEAEAAARLRKVDDALGRPARD